ncbi:MAG TPA: hypothetical protein VMZ04_02190, partial [Anaerolineae bacterium]|nr:hypothetical protein [Anaerolineae bacterium]
STNGPPPGSDARNTGKSGKIISLDISLKRLSKLSFITKSGNLYMSIYPVIELGSEFGEMGCGTDNRQLFSFYNGQL